jgi:N-acylneuraminate cytidylyltransferase
MKVIAFIFARGGSKGLPGKNVRLLCGKPLIAWSIEHAHNVKGVGRVIVSTDSEEIAEVARQYGAEIPFIRPADIAQDDSPEWLAWRHALNHLLESEGNLPDAMLTVPATAPLRTSVDIDRCLDEFSLGGADAVITVTEAHRSPYFNMVKKNADGTVGLVIQPDKKISRRQDSPVIYDVATVAYVLSPQFVLNHNALFDGRVRAIPIPAERAIDIDNLIDFKIAESLMKERLNEGN